MDVVPFEGNAPLAVDLIGSATDYDGILIEYGWSFENSTIIDATFFNFISYSGGSYTSYIYNTRNL